MRRNGWLLAVPLTPIVLIGALTTALIIPAILGIPILVVTARPWWLALNVGLGRTTPDDFSRSARVHVAACAAITLTVAVVCAFLGLDDFEVGQDGLIVLTLAAMLIAGAIGTVGLLTYRKASSAGASEPESVGPHQTAGRG